MRTVDTLAFGLASPPSSRVSITQANRNPASDERGETALGTLRARFIQGRTVRALRLTTVRSVRVRMRTVAMCFSWAMRRRGPASAVARR